MTTKTLSIGNDAMEACASSLSEPGGMLLEHISSSCGRCSYPLSVIQNNVLHRMHFDIILSSILILYFPRENTLIGLDSS